MKQKIYLFTIILISLIIFNSCSNEEMEFNEDIGLKTNTTLSNRTECNILGERSVYPGSTHTYTYTSDFNIDRVEWLITSGNDISIVKQSGVSITLSFGTNFTEGSLFSDGFDDGIGSCSEQINIVALECDEPTFMVIQQEDTETYCPGDILYFEAVFSNGSDLEGSYEWSVRGQDISEDDIVSTRGNTMAVTSPSSGIFIITVKYTNSCSGSVLISDTLPQYNSSCDDGDDDSGPLIPF